MSMRKVILFSLMILICFASAEAKPKTKKYKNGDYYEGEWKKGKPEGQGKMVFADGRIYEGKWINGKVAGDGVYQEPDGVTFSGQFTPQFDTQDIFVSIIPIKGKLTSSDSSYEGEWDGSISNFTGVMKMNGITYTGQLVGDKMINGRLEYGNDGGFLEGTNILTDDFEGTLNSQLKSTYLVPFPSKYNGIFHNKKFIGKVTGNKYSNEIGRFEMDVADDGTIVGDFVLNNATRYHGAVSNGKFYGNGEYTGIGLEMNGVWNDGILWSGTISETVKRINGSRETITVVVENGNGTYRLPEGPTLSLTGPFSAGYSLQSAISNYDNEQKRIALAAAEEAKNQARQKEIKDIDSKYVGLVFEGKAGISNDLANLVVGYAFNVIYTVSFLPNGRIGFKETTQSNSGNPYTASSMLAMMANADGNHVYDAKLDGNKILLGNSGFYVVVAPDKKSLKFYTEDSVYTLKRKGK